MIVHFICKYVYMLHSSDDMNTAKHLSATKCSASFCAASSVSRRKMAPMTRITAKTMIVIYLRPMLRCTNRRKCSLHNCNTNIWPQRDNTSWIHHDLSPPMIMISSGRICSLWLRTAMVEDGDQGGLTISSPDFSEGCCVSIPFMLGDAVSQSSDAGICRLHRQDAKRRIQTSPGSLSIARAALLQANCLTKFSRRSMQSRDGTHKP